MLSEEGYSPFDVKKLTVNIVTVVAIVGFFIWLTNSTLKEKENLIKELRAEREAVVMDLRREREQSILALRSSFHEQIDNLRAEIRSIKNDDTSHHEVLDLLNKRLDQIQTVLERTLEHHQYLVDNVWTKSDLALWCYEVQRKNAGFECPSYESLRQLGLIGGDEKKFHRAAPYKFDNIKKKLEQIEKDREEKKAPEHQD